MVVAGRIHRLRQVDDHRAVLVEQHVEFRQIAMHQPRAEHLDHFVDHERMELAGIVRMQVHVIQSRCGIAIFAGDHLHQQHAVEKVVGLGHPHAGIGQAKQRRDLGVLPVVFLLLAPVLGALGHGPGIATAAHLAAFLVFHGLAETALVGFLVDLGAAQLVAAAHHIYRCFLSAHQRSQHLVDQAILDQRFESFRRFHQLLAGPSR